MKDNNEEMFPVVDEDGNITGAATRGNQDLFGLIRVCIDDGK